jgi:hypothetical protein
VSGSAAPSRIERFRYEYGAPPLHLLAVVASLALAGYAFLRIFENPSTGGVLLWLGLAIISHDLIALPLYSALARIAHIGTHAAVHPRLATLTLNHIRIPAGLSLLALLVSFPLVFKLEQDGLRETTGLDADRYLGNWLLLVAVLFAGSALIEAMIPSRRGRARRERHGLRGGDGGSPPASSSPRARSWSRSTRRRQSTAC